MARSIQQSGAARPRLLRAVRRLRRDERGIAAVEYALLLPLLFFLLVGGVEAYDIYRYAEGAERTTYTIADLASRQNVAGDTMMADLHGTHRALLGGDAIEVRTRISSIEMRQRKRNRGRGRGSNKKAETVPFVTWTWDSQKDGLAQENKWGDRQSVIDLTDMPAVAQGDSILLIETLSTKNNFSSRLDDRYGGYINEAWVRPRYVATMVYN